ncbi:MAG: DUF3987 domain-containing protein [Chloracidobacterium sp.]|nr:DUF3987 domain-containing protein [Chloracidobacterium sp.]
MTAAEIEDRLNFAEVEPKELPNGLRPVPILDPQMIPEPLRLFVTDIAERMQCPIEYPAVAALVAAGAVIGNAVVVKPKTLDNWIVVSNIWGAIVGDPGAMKSPAVAEAMRFSKEIERRESAAFDALKADRVFESESCEAEKKSIRRQLEESCRAKSKRTPSEDAIGDVVDYDILRERFRKLEETPLPKPKRLITSDATVEKLGELLNDNPRGLLNLRDELSGFIDTLDKPGREGDRAFYLETWDGLGSYTVDRIARGSLHIKHLTLSIFGTIQPSIIAPLFKANGSKSVEDGFIQRFQATVCPDVPQEYEYIDREPQGVDEARQVFEGLYNLDLAPFDQLAVDVGGYRFVRFDPEAQNFFQRWLIQLEQSLRNDSYGSSSLRGHMAKYRGFMPALALIFHLIDHAANKNVGRGISLGNAELAAAWCSLFQAHAERLYDMTTQIGLNTAREILRKIQSGELGDEITARDIYRNKWSRLTEPAVVKAGLEMLVLHDYLHEVALNTGGKPKNVFLVNRNLRREIG